MSTSGFARIALLARASSSLCDHGDEQGISGDDHQAVHLHLRGAMAGGAPGLLQWHVVGSAAHSGQHAGSSAPLRHHKEEGSSEAVDQLQRRGSSSWWVAMAVLGCLKEPPATIAATSEFISTRFTTSIVVTTNLIARDWTIHLYKIILSLYFSYINQRHFVNSLTLNIGNSSIVLK